MAVDTESTSENAAAVFDLYLVLKGFGDAGQ